MESGLNPKLAKLVTNQEKAGLKNFARGEFGVDSNDGRGVRAPATILILLEGGKPSVDVFARLILRKTISLLQPTF
jgi:hypothetical protein